MMEDRVSSSIKIIDFGLAELFKPGEAYVGEFGGTLLYMAPEVFTKHITVKADIWSAGVILYNLVTGEFPFSSAWPPPPGCDQKWWEKDTARKIINDPLPSHARFGMVRWEAQELFGFMLMRNVERRPDASKCLSHPWFSIWDVQPPPLSVGVSQCLEAYSRQSELKQALFLMMARECHEPAIPELQALFTHFDVQNKGRVHEDDLRQVFSQCNLGPLSTERVLRALDRSGEGSVCWTEFLAAALCVKLPRKQENVDGAFAFFDIDLDGRLTMEELSRVFAHGNSKDEWIRQLPALFAELAGKSRLVQDVARVKGLKKPSASISLAQFRSYISESMDFTPGEGLQAGS
jgi:calcium-dependent protein kinase